MNIREAQEELRAGVKPSPDYPDLPNDFTTEALIAFNPMAELEYRMAKDRHPELTRAMIVQNWRSFRIAGLWTREKGRPKETKGAAFFRRAAELFRRKPEPSREADGADDKRGR